MSIADIKLREVSKFTVGPNGGTLEEYSGDFFETGLTVKVETGAIFKAASGKNTEISEKLTLTGAFIAENAIDAADFAAYDGKNCDIGIEFSSGEAISIFTTKIILSVKKAFVAGQIIKYNFSGELTASSIDEIMLYA